MTKPATSPTAVRPRSSLLLPALLLLAALLFAIAQLFIADPGADGGSGIGGTGRFSGESGIGGTGGPIKFGAFDHEDDSDPVTGETLAAVPAAPAAEALASAHVEVEALRLTPVKPAVMAVSRPAAAPTPPRAALEASLAAIDEAARARAAQELEALKTVDIDLSAERGEFDSRVRRRIEEDLDSTARGVSLSSNEVTRELLLVQAALDVGADVPPPVSIDVVGHDDDERRRLAVPLRPERPDRPSVPAQRFTPPQRTVPTPPVRPMRL